MVMPNGMNGRQLVTLLRKRKASLKVIYSSGYSSALLADESDKLDGLFLPKPYRPRTCGRRPNGLGPAKNRAFDGVDVCGLICRINKSNRQWLRIVRVIVVMNYLSRLHLVGWVVACLGMLLVCPTRGDNELEWNAESQTLDVSLEGAPLIETLEDLAHQTSWQIYLEPAPGKTFTTRFKGLSRGEAMRVLIGDMNYAFVPDAKGPTKLIVFRTSREAATIRIPGEAPRIPQTPTSKKISNQMVVKLKPGAQIEEIAKKLGAKVKGCIGDMNAYLLEFEDEQAMEKARSELANHEDVESIDYNYHVDRPIDPKPVTGNLPGPPKLDYNPGACGNMVVALIDTSMRSLGNGLDQFILPQLSLAGEAVPTTEMTHGPAMAEILLNALRIATGGSTGTRIRPVDVYGANASATTFDVANGIIRAVNSSPSPSIINLSLGSYSDSQFLRQVIQQATQLGITVFGAAGNDPVATPFLPAAWPEVISVTASDGPGQLARYANFSNSVDMMAPGTGIVHSGGQAFAVSGTSAASAYAAGLAAGLAEKQCISAQAAAASLQRAMPFPGATR